MLIKVFNKGQGAGYGPVEYVCALNPFEKGERTTPPQVIKGDPKMMRMQIDAVPFAWKYSSGVVSFAKEDAPTESQLGEMMDHFEELAFAGLPLSSRSIMWVSHKHTGRQELHFVIPRQEVHSGKSFNAFPPGWEKKFDHLRDMFNFKYGWARPDDPARARAWQPGVNALIQADAQRKGKEISPAAGAIITDHLTSLAFAGKIQTRADIVQVLKKLGYELPRQGKDYLTVLEPKSGTRTRLKGTLYNEDFHADAWMQHQAAAMQQKHNPVKIPNLAKAAEAETALQQAIQKIAQYNQNRYQLKEQAYVTIRKQPTASSAEDHRNTDPQTRDHLHGRRAGADTPATASQGSNSRENQHIGEGWRNTKNQNLVFQDAIGADYVYESLVAQQPGNSNTHGGHGKEIHPFSGSSAGGKAIPCHDAAGAGRTGDRSESRHSRCIQPVGEPAPGQSQTQRRGSESCLANAQPSGGAPQCAGSAAANFQQNSVRGQVISWGNAKELSVMSSAIAKRCAAISGLVTLDAVNMALCDTQSAFLGKTPASMQTVPLVDLTAAIGEQAEKISGQETLAILNSRLSVQHWKFLHEKIGTPSITNRLASPDAIHLLVGQLATRVTLDAINNELFRSHWVLPEGQLRNRELFSNMQGNALQLQEQIQYLSGQVTMQALEQRIQAWNTQALWKNLLPPPSSRLHLVNARIMSRAIRAKVRTLSGDLTTAAFAEQLACTEYPSTTNTIQEIPHVGISTKHFFDP